MKKWLCLALALLTLTVCVWAAAESTDWNYDLNYAILRGYNGAGGDVTVPAEIDGYTVDVIGVSVFSSEAITSLTLPETVLELRSNAVSGCENMTSVTLPQSLVVINRMNFFSCTSLEEVTIPAGVRYIGENSFRFCDALRKITFEGVCPLIDKGCFSLIAEDAVAYVPDDELEAYTEAFERAGIEVPVQPSGKNAVVVENNGFAEEDFEFDPATGTITSYNGFATYLAIPETIGGAAVKAIGPKAFAPPARYRCAAQGICAAHLYRAGGAARRAGNHRRQCILQLRNAGARRVPLHAEEHRGLCVLQRLWQQRAGIAERGAYRRLRLLCHRRDRRAGAARGIEDHRRQRV